MRAFGRREEPALRGAKARVPGSRPPMPRGGAGRERGPLAKGARGAREDPRPGRGSHPFPLSPPRLERATERGGWGREAPAAAPWPCPGDWRARGRAGEGHPKPRSARARAPQLRSRPGRFVRNDWPLRRPPLPPTGGPGAPASDPPRPPGPPPETEGAGGAASVPRGRCPGTRGGKGGQEGRRPLSPASRASAWA